MSHYDEFYKGMIRCALFTGITEDGDGTHFDDAGFTEADLTEQARRYLKAQAEVFCSIALRLGALDGTSDFVQAGIDFWFTRNGHGTGFIDKAEYYGTHAITVLEAIAEGFGEAALFETREPRPRLDLDLDSLYLFAQPARPAKPLMSEQKTDGIQWGEL